MIPLVIVASNAMLISLSLTVVVMLAPPDTLSVSVPTVTVSSEPASAPIVSADAPTLESTYALIDCCVAVIDLVWI